MTDVVSALDVALGYWRTGFQVVPGASLGFKNNKRPANAWHHLQETLRSEDQVRADFAGSTNPNMGFVCGRASGNLLVIDFDDYKLQASSNRWNNLIELHNNGIEIETVEQITGGGGRHKLFRCRPAWTPPTFSRPDLAIDCRGQGGYVVVAPSQHRSGNAYAWLPGRAPDECEVAICPDWLEAWIESIAPNGRTAAEPVSHKVIQAPPLMQAMTLANLGKTVDGRETKMYRTVAAVGRQLILEAGAAPSAEEIYKIGWPQYASSTSFERPGRGPDEFMQKCQTFVRRFQSGKIKSMPSVEAVIAETTTLAPETPHPFSTSPYANAVAAVEITPALYSCRDPSTIPPRQWLYDKHYIRKYVSCTVAPGGSGKSSLFIAEALAMCTGKPLLGHAPSERVPVWIWNGEDPLEETHRRIEAARLHYKLSKDEIDGWLYVNSGRNDPIIMGVMERNSSVIHYPLAEAMTKSIRDRNIGVFMVDPFISVHKVTENDNNAIQEVVRAFANIADAANCSIELAHHTKKINGQPATVEDGRGASSLLAACRSGRVINAMPDAFAKTLGVENPRLYFSLDRGKGNMAPPPECTEWHMLNSVALGNGRGFYPSGDQVAVVSKWTAPNMTAGLTGTDFEKAAAKIKTDAWRLNEQSPMWVGHALAAAWQIDADKNADRARIKAALKMYLASGALVVVKDHDEHRKLKDYVIVAAE